MSLLLANGHPYEQVWYYPLGTLADEADLVVERDNQRIASEGLTLHAAASAVISGDGEHFKGVIKRLVGE